MKHGLCTISCAVLLLVGFGAGVYVQRCYNAEPKVLVYTADEMMDEAYFAGYDGVPWHCVMKTERWTKAPEEMRRYYVEGYRRGERAALKEKAKRAEIEP